MFTGIIEEFGTITSVRKNGVEAVLCISAKTVLEGTKIGDSISVNGVCLTVTGISGGILSFFVMNETMQKTVLKNIVAGDKVNLERAVRLDTRLGGHFVSGHIDGTGKIAEVKRDNGAVIFSIEVNSTLLRYIIYKGSVAIDGVSLTCLYVDDNSFKVSLIPHTMVVTALNDKKIGDMVNIECDLIGKYVEKLMMKQDSKGSEPKKKSIEKLLEEAGF